MIKKLTYTRIAGLIFFLLFSNWSIGQIETRHIGKNFFVESNSNLVVVGAGSIYNGNPTTNSTGGDISSAHTHFVDPISYTTPLGQGTHAHSGTTSGPSGTYDPAVSWTTHDVASDNHTHTFSTAATQGAHQHTINLPPKESTGASNTDNLPPYFSLFFIMKL